MGMLDDGMLNAWCIYWPPDGTDDYGQPVHGAPAAYRCNWADVDNQTLVIDGTMHSVAHSVYLAASVALGGYLWRVPRGSMAATADAADVLAAGPATPPRHGRILQVSQQADLDDEVDIVHKALL